MPLLKDQKYDAGMGCLTLAKAGVFTVDITKRDGLHEGAPEKLAPFKRLTQEQVFAMPNVDDRKVYVKDHNERDKKEAEYNKERDAFNKKLHEELATLSWCWQTVQNGMEGQTMAHNTAQTKGLPADAVKSFTFPEVLEGGGLLWLEAFTQNDPATGKTPNGLFVRATGVPEIIRAVWTDLDCKPIIGKVKVGSKVLLNIYTKGLYGQDFEIGLWSQSTDNPETLLPIANKGNFRHEALTYKILPSEENKDGMSGGMLVEGKSESRVQKIRIPVTVNPIWMFAAPKGLAIYHTIKHLNTGLYFKDYKATAILDIAYDGKLHETVIEPTNNPLLVGKVETNVANFEPCQYTAIELINNKGEITELYKQDNAQKTSSAIETGVIVGSEKKKYTLQVDSESNTQECSRSITKDGKKVDDHHTKQLSVGNSLPSNVTVLSQTPAKIDFETWFDYGDDKIDLFDYFFLTESKLKTFPGISIKAATCRHHHDIYVRTVPDIDWKFALSVSSTLPDTYSYTGMPSGDINKNHNDKALKSVKTRTQLNTSPSPVSFDLKIKATTNKKDSFEVSAGYEAKIRSVLSALISIKDTIDDICNTKQAKASSVPSLFKKRIPVTLKIDYPVISIMGAWKLGYDVENPSLINTQGSISLGFNPLIKGEGAIDLLACLEIYPVAKAVIKSADLVLASVKGEMWFDIYVYGAINLNGDVFFNKKEIADIQIDTVFGIGARLGVKAGVTTKKITFNGDKTEDVSLAGAELSGRGETSVKLKAKRGLDDKGAFIEIGADFGGMIVFVTAKVKIFNAKAGIEDTPFVLLDPKPDFFKKRMHIIE